MNRLERWQVPASAAGERLDRYLARQTDQTRNQIQRWIREGRVSINGALAKPALLLSGGEVLEYRSPTDEVDSPVVPEPGKLDLLYEDDDIVVLNKPAGVTVHPGAGRPRGTLANVLLARYPEMAGAGSPQRPGIVHRLDEGTSGVLVVARSSAAHRHLAAAFAGRRVHKRYLGVVYGSPTPSQGRVDKPIARHPRERKRMTVRAGGRPALTAYRTLAVETPIALLELDLATGRNHQIRVHLKSLGHPLVGDPVYGEARWRGLPAGVQGPLRAFPRPALHAWWLSFHHPRSGAPISFAAPVPADLRQLWEEVTQTPFPELTPPSPPGEPP